jgi:hypothetical protein
MDSKASRQKSEEAKRAEAYLAGAILVFIAVLYVYPELLPASFLGLIGAFLAPLRFADPDERRRWRLLGFWEIATGAGIAGAYFALRAPLRLVSESHRFERAWHDGLHIHPAALIVYPWGWAPIAFALALTGAGAFTAWRAR